MLVLSVAIFTTSLSNRTVELSRSAIPRQMPKGVRPQKMEM
jgi:hypothetical protein